MTLTATGFPGTVNSIQMASMAAGFGSEWEVEGPLDFECAPTAGDRMVRVRPGVAHSGGVRVLSTADELVQLDAVTSGSRYDLICLRRNWAGGGSVDVRAVKGSASAALPPAGTGIDQRNAVKGSIEDQPLALFRVTAGQTTPVLYVDYRAWAHKVYTSQALPGLPRRKGAEAVVQGRRYRYVEDPFTGDSDGFSWIEVSTPRVKVLPIGEGGTVARPGGTARQLLVVTGMTGTSTPPAGIMRVTLSVDVTGGAAGQDVAGYFWAETGDGIQQGKTRFHTLDGTEGMVSVSLGPVVTNGDPMDLQVCASLDAASAPVTFGRPRTSAWVEYVSNQA